MIGKHWRLHFAAALSSFNALCVRGLAPERARDAAPQVAQRQILQPRRMPPRMHQQSSGPPAHPLLNGTSWVGEWHCVSVRGCSQPIGS
jgi:hypothetical protein